MEMLLNLLEHLELPSVEYNAPSVHPGLAWGYMNHWFEISLAIPML